MNTFAQNAKKYSNFTETENGATALRSTGSELLNLFATAGALRLKSDKEVASSFKSAFAEDKLLATKLMFYTRNVRGGLGERDAFRKMLKTLATIAPSIVVKNLALVPVFGRYDDLYTLVGTEAEEEMWKLIKETIKTDAKAYKAGKSISLCAKWLKSVNTSSKESNKLGKLTAKHLGLTEKQYRKMLSSLRSYTNVVETIMSSKAWDKIDYSAVPSYAMSNYRKAFASHDAERFENFIGKVEKGEEKINSSTLFPYDIFTRGNLRWDNNGYRNAGKFALDEDRVLEQQWKALPNYVEGENNVLVMADTSGSMWGLPICVSLSLAIYFAERNKGAYKDLFMTFSETPRFVSLSGNTLNEKLNKVESEVANTNLEAAFDLILSVAKNNNVPSDEMPKSLIIISDMHFDQATASYGRGAYKKVTHHEDMKAKYEQAGYAMPTVIYWNVQERGEAFQVSENDQNVVLVSGQSASTFKAVLGNIGRTPWDFMVEVLNDEMYSVVTI